MAAETRFELVYWPLPFRGCFVSYLFAWCDVPLKVVDDSEVIEALNVGLGIMLQSGEWAAIVSEGLKEQPTALVN